LKTALKNATATTPDGSSKSLVSLDQAIARLQTLKRKLSSLQESQETYSAQSAARIEHLDELYHIPTLADVKYEEWSQTRLDRLLVDYLVRKGYTKSARALAADREIEKLVDVDEFESLTRIERSLRQERRVDLALTWCGENKQTLKKMEVCLLLERTVSRNAYRSDSPHSNSNYGCNSMLSSSEQDKKINFSRQLYMPENTLLELEVASV